MRRHSKTNPADNIRWGVTYLIGRRILLGLETCLAGDLNSPGAESLDRDSLMTVSQCCGAGADILTALDAAWMDGDPLPACWPAPPSSMSPGSKEIMGRVSRVLAPLLPPMPLEECATQGAMPKWRLMYLLSSDCLLQIGVFVVMLLEANQPAAVHMSINALRGGLQAAMGMLYELKEANWREGQLIPAGLMQANHAHGSSEQSFGAPAVMLMECVHQRVSEALANEQVNWSEWSEAGLPALRTTQLW